MHLSRRDRPCFTLVSSAKKKTVQSTRKPWQFLAHGIDLLLAPPKALALRAHKGVPVVDPMPPTFRRSVLRTRLAYRADFGSG
jgi:hypothetical protein